MSSVNHPLVGPGRSVQGPVHRNNFDGLRIGAALFVLFSHQFSIMGRAQPFDILGRTTGEIAVAVFFTISGYLISQSWLADPHLIRFCVKRFLRVYPALIVVLLLSVCVLGPLLTSADLVSYLSDATTWHYVVSNLAMKIVYPLPGLFLNNPVRGAVNGSLWTLPYELRWYLYLLIFGITGLLRWRAFVGVLWLVMFFHYIFVYDIDATLQRHGDHRWAEELGLFFVAGMLLLSTHSLWRQHVMVLFLCAVVAAAALYVSGRPNGTLAILLPVTTIIAGTQRTPWFGYATYLGDLSYGIYIYAFPIQQSVSQAVGDRFGVAIPMLLCFVMTMLLAYCSWHCVEKNALQWKRKFRAA